MKKLYLSDTDRKISGVCGGIAEYLNIDSTVIRLIWVVLSFIPPFPGVIVYILAAIIMPRRNMY